MFMQTCLHVNRTSTRSEWIVHPLVACHVLRIILSLLQVLDEIGVSFGEEVPEAPAAGVAQGGAAEADTARQPVAAAEASGGGGGGGGGGGAQPPGGAGGDANMSELEARLNNLRRGS